ncbi:MAG: STAS domain-containing protein [Neptuniibacter sp.]
MSARALLDSDGVLQLSGDLKFPVIVQLRKQIERILDGASGSVQVDFSGVEASDSSALSLWMCCLRYAGSMGVDIASINVPEEMIQFAHLVGLDDLLN